MSLCHACRTAVLLTLALATPLTAIAATTLPTGGGQPFSNEQPSLAMSYVVRVSGAADELGEVGLFAGGFAPVGWAEADGQLMSVAANPDLFALLGTSFGGDGESTFALPDLRDRTPIGVGSGPGLPSYALGEMVGSSTTTLTEAPPHSHGLPGGHATESAGAAAAHSNLQPSLALTPVIAVSGLFPPRNAPVAEADGDPSEGVSVFTNDPFLGEVTWLAHDEVPSGWMKAEGQLLNITSNDALFALLGTTYGGDGRTTFGLPDLRGRAIIGQGTGPGLTPRPLGAAPGAADETLNSSHLPSHTHDLPGGGQTEPTGEGAAQSNMQPSLALRQSVALEGIYPARNAPTADGPSSEGPDSDGSDSGGPAESIGGGDQPYIASITTFAGFYSPRGHTDASGQTLPIAQYSALFSVLGTTYGGDGRTNFKLPDLRGRVPVGVGSQAWGQDSGAESSNLTIANLPGHTHEYLLPGDYNDDGVVDAADYTVWRDHQGDPAGALANDPTGEAIGAAQYDLWRDNYGLTYATTPAPEASQSTPEPAAALLALVGLAAFRLPRRRG